MITITNDNIYSSDFSITNIRNPEHINIVNDDDIIGYLSNEIELGESVTLERLFDIIKTNESELNNIYYSCLGGYPLSSFLTEINDIPSEKPHLDYLEINWYSEIYDDELTIISSFHGISIENNKKITYSISFSPLNNLKYLNIKLNENVSIFDYSNDEKYFNLGNKRFTLFEFFYAILFEISFNGDPSGRKNRLDDLEKSIDESSIDESIDSKNNTYDIDDIDKFFENLDKKDIYLVKYKDLRDRVDEDLDLSNENLEPLKNCLLEKLKIYDKIIKSKAKKLTKFYKKISDNEFNMQILYGVVEDENSHRFWETPKCTCPKIDNIVKFPNGNYIFDEHCPIHNKC